MLRLTPSLVGNASPFQGSLSAIGCGVGGLGFLVWVNMGLWHIACTLGVHIMCLILVDWCAVRVRWPGEGGRHDHTAGITVRDRALVGPGHTRRHRRDLRAGRIAETGHCPG